MSNLNKTLKSSLLLILESASKKLVGLVSTLILARLLTPEDFGIVAIATLTFGFLEVVSQTGCGQYIHTVKEVNSKVINTAFTYNLILKGLVALAFACFIPVIASYYEDARLYPVLMVFSIMLAATGFINPQVYVLQREQSYGKVVKMVVIAKVISTLVAIITAVVTKSYWALVGGQFFAYTLPVIGGYIIAPYHPSLTLGNIKQQFSFSGWLVPSSMLGYVRAQVDTILVTRLFDAASLGSYHVMKYLAFIPTLHIIAPMTAPLLAQLASVKDNQEYFGRMFNISFLITLAIALPISQLMFSYADTIIVIFLGRQWGDFSPIFSLFSVLIFFSAIFQHGNRCFLIFSNTRMSFLFEFAAATLISLFLLSTRFESTYEFALSKIVIEMALSLSILTYSAIHYTSFRFYVRAVLLSFVLIGISFCCMSLLNVGYGLPEGIMELAIACALFGGSYGLSVLGLIYLFRNTLHEARYIWSLVYSNGKPILNKLNLMC